MQPSPSNKTWLDPPAEESSSPTCRSSTRTTTCGIPPRRAWPSATCSTSCWPTSDAGHRVVATVFLQCCAMHRADGPEALRPVGETEFVNGVAAMSASGIYGPPRLRRHRRLRRPALGDRVGEVLEAHLAAGGGRFRGIRHAAAGTRSDRVRQRPRRRPPARAARRPGVPGRLRRLAPLGLTFDAWLLHPQLPELTALARAFPDTTIVLDHVGAPLGIGPYAGRRDAVFADWRPASPSSRPARTWP